MSLNVGVACALGRLDQAQLPEQRPVYELSMSHA